MLLAFFQEPKKQVREENDLWKCFTSKVLQVKDARDFLYVDLHRCMGHPAPLLRNVSEFSRVCSKGVAPPGLMDARSSGLWDGDFSTMSPRPVIKSLNLVRKVCPDCDQSFACGGKCLKASSTNSTKSGQSNFADWCRVFGSSSESRAQVAKNSPDRKRAPHTSANPPATGSHPQNMAREHSKTWKGQAVWCIDGSRLTQLIAKSHALWTWRSASRRSDCVASPTGKLLVPNLTRMAVDLVLCADGNLPKTSSKLISFSVSQR